MDTIRGYVETPDLPAGDGWCEVIVTPTNGDPDRYCYTMASEERDGHRVCGLHRHRTGWRYGPSVPTVDPVAQAVTVVYEVVQPEGYSWSLDAHGPLPFFDGEGRRLWLMCWSDGSVTWELRAKDKTVLEPSL
jgi:hypothetical protein